MHSFLKILLTYITLCFSLGLAAEEDDNFIKNIIVFGDSLFDSGNFGITFTNPNTDGSNGKIAIDYFAEGFNLDLNPSFSIEEGTNYAVGGYTTPEILNSVTKAGGSRLLFDHDGDPTTPDIDSVPAKNGYLQDYGTIDRNTAVFINGGGNNFLDGLISDLASIQNSVSDIATAISALDASGAKYIFVSTLPNLAYTPNTNGSASLKCASLGFALDSEECSGDGGTLGEGNSILNQTQAPTLTAVQSYNAVLASASNNLSANIIPIDYWALHNAVLEDPAAYGYNPELGDALYKSCYTGFCEHPVLGENSGKMPDQLLFNDGVHPTQYAQRLLGAFMLDVVRGPAEIALLPRVGLNMSLTQSEAIAEQMKSSRWLGKPHENNWFSSFQTKSAGQGNNGAAANGDLVSQLLTVGYTHHAKPHLRTAIAVHYDSANLSIDNNASKYKSDGYGFSFFTGYQPQWFFIEGSLAIASLKYYNRRNVDLFGNTFTALSNPTGFSWNAEVKMGIDVGLKNANLTLAPFVALNAAQASTSHFAEYNARIANYEYSKLRYEQQQFRCWYSC